MRMKPKRYRASRRAFRHHQNPWRREDIPRDAQGRIHRVDRACTVVDSSPIHEVVRQDRHYRRHCTTRGSGRSTDHDAAESRRTTHKHGLSLHTHAGPEHQLSKESDRAQDRFGYFLIGSPHQSSLWRIRRAQVSDSGRPFYSLQPAKPAAGMPEPDFDRSASTAAS